MKNINRINSKTKNYMKTINKIKNKIKNNKK